MVLGYDGSRGADIAMRFAAAEADKRGLPLVVARFYAPTTPGDADLAEQTVREAEEKLTASHPDLKTGLLALPAENTAHGLIELSREAAITVVGSRGHGGFTGLLLGSVGGSLIHHGSGPIAIVHPARVSAEV